MDYPGKFDPFREDRIWLRFKAISPKFKDSRSKERDRGSNRMVKVAAFSSKM